MRPTLFPVIATLMVAGLLPLPTVAQNDVGGSIDDLARQIVDKSHSTDGNTIAISAFPHVDDSCSELSNFLVDELVLSLFNVPDVDVQIIERSQLGRIFAELELSMSGAVDANTTQELGRIHGVDTLLVGSLTTIGDDLRINARLIDTESGRVFSAAAVNMPKTSTLEVLMERPATGGCTMTPMAQGNGGSGEGSGATPASVGAKTMSLDTGHLEGFEQLVGVWEGTVDCEDATHQIRFYASEQLSNGVSGNFAWSGDRYWGENYEYENGSSSLILQPDSENGPTFTLSGRQGDLSVTADLTLFGSDAMYGDSRFAEDCTVSIGRRQAQDTDEG